MSNIDCLPIRPQPTNFAGIDFVRGLAALGVILLHAGVPYLQNPMPGLAWPVQDGKSSFVDAVFWGNEIFIMPVFLILAGMLAWRTVHRKGQRALISSRARRLLIPFAFGLVVILPADLYVWLAGWVTEGIIAPVKLKSLKFENGIDKELWGTSHLWFLMYLFLFVAALGIGYRFFKGQRWSTRWTAAAILLAGITSLVFAPEVVWGFQHAFLPVPSKFIYSMTFFMGGALIAAKDPGFHRLNSVSSRLILPAIALLAFTIALGRWSLSGGSSDLANTTLAAMTTISAWAVSLGLIGLAIQHITHLNKATAYLAAASFWVYLVHHPILGLIHVDLKLLMPSVAPGLKMCIAFVLCSFVSLLTYEAFVRKTRLGRWLGFAWQFPDQTPEEPAAAVDSFDQPRMAA